MLHGVGAEAERLPGGQARQGGKAGREGAPAKVEGLAPRLFQRWRRWGHPQVDQGPKRVEA
eukprot:10775581-Alexandrium_andersonii.AAC.1